MYTDTHACAHTHIQQQRLQKHQAKMTVRLHPSSYLSIPRFSLIEALLETLPRHEHDDWVTFAQSMSYVVNGAYAAVMERMRMYAWEETTGKHRTEDESKKALFLYLTRLLSLISAAQYTPMSDQHWAFGVTSQNYSSGQHVEVNMADTEEMFKEYFEKHVYWFGPGTEANEGVPAPDFSSRCMLFFRGTTVIKSEGLHIQGKVKYVVTFWLSVLASVCRLLRLSSFLPRMPSSKIQDLRNELMSDDAAVHSRFGPKKLERVTLDSYIKQHGIFKSMFRKITLIEPAFSSVIVVYPSPDRRKQTERKDDTEKQEKPETEADPTVGRCAVSMALAGLGKLERKSKSRRTIAQNVFSLTRTSLRRFEGQGPSKRSKEEKGPHAGESEEDIRQNTELSSVISIENYDRVPFRDLGLLIPGRQVRLGLVHKGRFAVEFWLCVLLFVSCLLCLEYPSTVQSFLVLVFLFLSFSKGAQVLQGISELQKQLNTQMGEWLDQRIVGKGNAFVTSLVNQVQEQELKEILLGYFFLWKKSPLTQRQLDYEVETFLNDQFRLELDFEVEDALQKLISLKLIEEVGGKFRFSQNPKNYLDDPHPRWLDFFHSFTRTASDESDHSGSTTKLGAAAAAAGIPQPSREQTPQPPRRQPQPSHMQSSLRMGQTLTGHTLDSTIHLSDTQSSLLRTTSLNNSLTVPSMPRRRTNVGNFH